MCELGTFFFIVAVLYQFHTAVIYYAPCTSHIYTGQHRISYAVLSEFLQCCAKGAIVFVDHRNGNIIHGYFLQQLYWFHMYGTSLDVGFIRCASFNAP